MDRRDAIKNIGMGFGAFVATPAALSILHSCGSSMEPWTPAYFSEQQGAMLRKLVDGILPGVDDLPSATNANVHVFIDKYLAEVMPLDSREEMQVSMDVLASTILETADAEDHEDVSDEAIQSILSNNLSKSTKELEVLDESVWQTLGTDGKTIADLPDDLKVYSVLKGLRSMAIWAYRTNEIVGKNVLAYDPVPGTFIGCGDLQELSGGRDWAGGHSVGPLITRMVRRDFIRKTLLSGSLALGSPFVFAEIRAKEVAQFKLNYAPHIGMFEQHAGMNPLDQLNFIADQGFTAFEDNEMKARAIATQEAMAKTMTDRGIRMGVFVAHKIYWKEPNLASGKLEWRKQFLQHIKESVEVAKRVNAKWMTVVPGHLDLTKDLGYQMSNVVESLKQASAILEPHGLVMVLEPLNFRDHPGLFLTKSAQAFEICKAVNSPSCKILFDVYHQQITEGNLIPNIENCWEEIAYFQVGDNPGRKEPGTGEINYKNVFKYLYSRGFDGIVGMEHGNSIPGKDGELNVIEAYKQADSF